MCKSSCLRHSRPRAWDVGSLSCWVVEIEELRLRIQNSGRRGPGHPPSWGENPPTWDRKSTKLEANIHQVSTQNRLKSVLGDFLEGSWGHLGPMTTPVANMSTKVTQLLRLLGAKLGAKIHQLAVSFCALVFEPSKITKLRSF